MGYPSQKMEESAIITMALSDPEPYISGDQERIRKSNMVSLSASQPTSAQAPTHAYPDWLSSARIEFNLLYSREIKASNCPFPLEDALHRATDLGRRIRPSLYYAFYHSLSSEYPKGERAMPAVALEHFHAASIIVDDIADGELCRRDKRPVYRDFGIDIAILASHFLSAAGYRALTKSEFSETLTRKWTDCFMKACIGQAYDYVRDPKIPILEQQFRSLNKTVSFFAFAGDALDIMHGKNSYRNLLSALGRIFQISNDVIDLFEFENSSRHAVDEEYTLRLSYLVPTLLELDIIKEKELFSKLPFQRHIQIARRARATLPSANEMLMYQSRAAKQLVTSFDLPNKQRTMANTFIDHCCSYSFWNHDHDV